MCTSVRFTDKDGNLCFGRNLDWGFDYGETPVIVPRNYTWHSLHNGDITTNSAICGMGIMNGDLPLYFDCANEDGLGVAGLSFAGYAVYADAPVEGKYNVPTYEFPLWIASSFKTVDEAEAALKNTVVTNDAVSKELPVSPMHWIVYDNKRALVYEMDEQGVHLYDDDFDALTNQPNFYFHRENIRAFMCATPEWPADAHWREATIKPYGTGLGMRQIPGDCSSPSRFIRAAYMNAFYPEVEGEAETVSRLFHILGNVAMVLGQCKMEDGALEHTLYTGGWYQATKTYYWSTYDHPSISKVTLDETHATAKNISVIKVGQDY
jgi:choloylglycine hydrolase